MKSYLQGDTIKGFE